jgi:tryptophanyl-tRNA synthetase
MKLIFSGMQPTGNLHLGNYLGALRNWVKLQNQAPCMFCVVDLHALTIPQNPAELKSATREVAAAYMAAGIDAKTHILFNQSRVHEHAELAWIFNCVARLGWLNRMTQFKDKAGKNQENATTGLYIYPNLMAADILVHHADAVPVGEDQKQHLELTRDIAKAFNSMYGVEFFPLPEPVIQGPGARIMSLRDGTKKMSKSDASDMSRINLTDDRDTIANKIRRAKTDPHPLPETMAELAKRPEAENLIGIYAGLADIEAKDALGRFAGKQFSEFKGELAELAVSVLGPINAEMQRMKADPGFVDSVLHRGAERASASAAPILKKTHEIVGLLRP